MFYVFDFFDPILYINSYMIDINSYVDLNPLCCLICAHFTRLLCYYIRIYYINIIFVCKKIYF